MKHLFSLLVLVVTFSTFSFATVRTLCNMPYNPGQYNNFSDVHNASSPSDTIYVLGSTINYGSIYIDKPLVIIGTGHHPAKQNPLVSSFLRISISTSDVQLIGLRFENLYSNGYNNCSVKKCRVLGNPLEGSTMRLSNVSNWLIEGNIIEGNQPIYFGSYAAPNTIIQNNIFISQSPKIGGIGNNSSQRTYILNNIFIGQAGNSITFYSIEYAVIDNNIFYSSIPDGNFTITNCSMNNNISAASDDDVIYQPGANNIISDPGFVNYPGYQAMYDYDWDLSLQASSPGKNYGTDGTDVGVFGGMGFKFTKTGEPSIAEITAFTITSPTVIPPGGNLTISVTSKRVH